MTHFESLIERNPTQCELCSSTEDLSPHQVTSAPTDIQDSSILICQTCLKQLTHQEAMNPKHWHCLNETMWTEIPALKVMIWRILSALTSEMWAQDLLDQLYMEEDLLSWAKQSPLSPEHQEETQGVVSRDSFGNILSNGDSVTLIKDLDVKGANFTAKRGTVVKNISLTADPTQIEGRVNGTQIVLLTQYLKKS